MTANVEHLLITIEDNTSQLRRELRRAIYKRLFSEGLAMANRGNIFWTKSDAMQAFAIYHKGE